MKRYTRFTAVLQALFMALVVMAFFALPADAAS